MRRTAQAKRRAGYARVLRQYTALDYVGTEVKFTTTYGQRRCCTPLDIHRLPRRARYCGTVVPGETHADAVRWFMRVGSEAFDGLEAATRAAANTMRMTVFPVKEELHICIDADCPACGWPERWFSPDRSLFGCSKCSFTSTQRDGSLTEVAEHKLALTHDDNEPVIIAEDLTAAQAKLIERISGLTPTDLAKQELGQMSGKVHGEVPDQYLEEWTLAVRLATEIVDGAERGYSSRARKRAGIQRTTRFKRDVLLEFWRWIQALSIEETGSMLQVPEIVIRARAGE